MIVYFHPGFAAPLGDHIVPTSKFALVAEALRSRPEIELHAPEPLTEADLRRVHSPAYIEAVRTGQPRWLAESQRLPWTPELFPTVCLRNGGCAAAAERALSDGVAAALVSGFHHASAEHGEGFCTFNGLVLALDLLFVAGKIKTGAILDMDLHYGNGTAQLAATREHIFAVSLYGNDYWNNFSYRDVTAPQHEDGANHVSFALPAECDGPTLERIMDDALPLIAERKPDLLLYQAGADPLCEDPYSPLALNHADLRARDLKVFRFARTHGIPIAWVLAGGYTDDIQKVVQVHLNTFDACREAHAS